MNQTAQSDFPPLPVLPAHVGIIMDGNGRWARQKGMLRLAGHRAGVENLRQVLRSAVELGVPILTIYAFSTENWARPEDEVRGLMRLLADALEKEVDELHKNGVQLRHIGDLSPLSEALTAKIQAAVDLTRGNDRLIANIAFNYGGRQEIVSAVRELIADGIAAKDVSEEEISQRLYTAGLPDVDLVIRTSGENRISNFMLWQAAYAEYYISPVYWPDFDKDEFYRALKAFSQRDRRYGRIKKS
jgi:undecaprenyl diphosphate synthase